MPCDQEAQAASRDEPQVCLASGSDLVQNLGESEALVEGTIPH
jgi:hypothetical protein